MKLLGLVLIINTGPVRIPHLIHPGGLARSELGITGHRSSTDMFVLEATNGLDSPPVEAVIHEVVDAIHSNTVRTGILSVRAP